MDKVRVIKTTGRCDYAQRGSDVNGVKIIDLFPKFCADTKNVTLADIKAKRFPKDTELPFFRALVDIYRRGYTDEALRLAAIYAIPSKLSVFYAYDDAEAAILRVVAKISLIAANRDIPHADADDWKYHQIIEALHGSHRIHKFTSLDREKMPKYARTTAPDRIQIKSAPPPLGTIPNPRATCYAASVLTCLFSIEHMVAKYAKKPDCFGLITWFLRTDNCTGMEVAEILKEMLQIPELKRFDTNAPEDTLDFLSALVRALDLGPRDLKIYSIPSIHVLADTAELKTKEITLDFEIEQDGDEWTYAKRTSIIRSNQMPSEVTCEIRSSGEKRTFTEIIEEEMRSGSDSPRDSGPEILVLCHSIFVKEDALDFPIRRL
jgi:hypothetical protein